jgi:hypothetical protein
MLVVKQHSSSIRSSTAVEQRQRISHMSASPALLLLLLCLRVFAEHTFAAGSAAAAAAVVPPGRFWELNVVRDCPRGLYREGFVNTTDLAGISCLSCPDGWTTPTTATGSRQNCSGEIVFGFE